MLPFLCHSFRYIEEFSKLSIQDVESRKTIEITETCQTNIDVPINNLSQKLTDILPMILYADLLEKKAIALLNTPESIVLSPSAEPQDGNKCYLVASAGGKPRPDFYTVKLSNKAKVVCNCKGYRFAKICSHAVAVAEKNRVLLELVKGVKISHRSALTYPNGSRGHGRKGKCNRRFRNYMSQHLQATIMKKINALLTKYGTTMSH